MDKGKENVGAAKPKEGAVRITRARARALGTSGGQIHKPPRPDQKRVLRANCKRAAAEEIKPTTAPASSIQYKKRAVLKDVTNVACGKSYVSSLNAPKLQTSKQAKRLVPLVKSTNNFPVIPRETLDNQAITREKICDHVSKFSLRPHAVWKIYQNEAATSNDESTSDVLELIEETAEKYFSVSGKSRSIGECLIDPPVVVERDSRRLSRLDTLRRKGCEVREKSETVGDLDVVNIDSNHKDPQMCCLYAPDIYKCMRVTELNQRHNIDYMETVQRDITQSMRGILIDWLVEVSEEYKLVPDTLYLTVNLIDRFLSQNYIGKQRLQLLGVSCMLIASKYEEICAPRVDEFCFITDNTYTKDEVLKMEIQVLNFLQFKLSVPTTKTFLRRFVQAAQATNEVPSFDLEFLANYLAELTLVEYMFLKYLPSLVAASAVFLARWTLDQSAHPWNPTLEYYTRYKTLDLKVAVIAMQDLQSNVKNCPLNAVREKYRQEKFNGVANLPAPKPVQSLF